MKKYIVLIFIVSNLVVGQSFADKPGSVLSNAELERIFAGKTAIGRHIQKNLEVRDYYSKKGHFTSQRSNGDRLKGKWWISKKRDAICIKYKHISDKSFCRAVVADGKGGYDKIYEKDGKVLIHYDRVVKGNKTKTD